MNVLDKTQAFAEKLLIHDLPKAYLYHNINHTKRVVSSAEEILENTEIDPELKQVILVSAWLHDLGYTVSHDNHEEKSVEIATNFLKDINQSENFITAVTKCIRATKMDNTPESLEEKIIRDADSGHFASEEFSKTSELLRQELQRLGIENYNTGEWRGENIDILSNTHKYYTKYAIQHWSEKKEENLMELIKKDNKFEKKLHKEKVKAKYKAKYKNENPERSIQTLFRITLRNHLKLSDIADTKANILLSVNAIIISLALSNIIPKLDNPSNQHLMIPTLVLVIFGVASIILSIMSTKPNVTSGEFSKEEVKQRKVNILFFGNFHKMKFEDYLWGIKQITGDKDYVYEALTKDLYYLGIVLERKYKLLRITYTVFLLGIIISVMSFIFAFYLM
ncbi:MAG: DUF5706 domain-containing protein [Psychroflexus sp.]|nr:DUF5706 domain-containing protein [Psychroflexus sp.]MDN6309787.1 DUF5706 domain-containing protein [Psychroflexus sp.]